VALKVENDSPIMADMWNRLLALPDCWATSWIGDLVAPHGRRDGGLLAEGGEIDLSIELASLGHADRRREDRDRESTAEYFIG
jgi:hypothetical protein